MSKSAIEAQRFNGFFVEPEMLTLVEDKEHHLYDDRVHLPVDESLGKSLMAVGNKVALLVTKEGDQLFVVEGRQRVKAAIWANKKLAKDGKEPLKLKVILEKGEPADLFGTAILTNELRQGDGVVTKAIKCKRYIDMGRTEADAALAFGITTATVKNWLSILTLSGVVKKAIESGKISATAAMQLCEIPLKEQGAALDKLMDGVGKPTVKKSRKVAGKKTKPKKTTSEGGDVEGEEGGDDLSMIFIKDKLVSLLKTADALCSGQKGSDFVALQASMIDEDIREFAGLGKAEYEVKAEKDAVPV